MSKGVIHCMFLGRLGNAMFTYAFCRAYAEKHDLELVTDQWDGENIFQIKHARPSGKLDRRDENNLVDGEINFSFRSYAQQQKCMIYTREQIKRWFQFQDVHEQFLSKRYPPDELLAHRRVGDYPGYQMPVVSEQAYRYACREHGLDESKLHFITEESPTLPENFSGPTYIPDFWRLCKCKTLLRGNSSFSWWAAALNDGDVYAPVINGCSGLNGEVMCPFAKGNHPRMLELEFVTDLHLKP